MSPLVRRVALVVHVACSVGWLGAVAAFLAVAVVGLRTTDLAAARGAYFAMDVVARLIILPACVASLVTGLVQSLGTPWGLFRHYWVIVKLLVTVASTAILLLHMRPIAFLADAAALPAFAIGDHAETRLQVVVDAAAAVVALLVTTTLSVLKPRGLTRYGWRKQREEAAP
jgi:hypothetical protein